MKRNPLYLAYALIFVIGATLLGVNWRLNHPPLSAADREFRHAVAGADRVIIRQKKPVGFVARGAPMQTLDARQTQALLETLRFIGASSQLNAVSLAPLELTFARQGQSPARFELYQTPTSSELENLEKPYQTYKVHPRFEKPLREFLNEVAPTRIQP